MNPPNAAASFVPIVYAGEEQRDQFRAQHGVNLVEGDNDGQGVHRLPNGSYGFTYSPGVQDTPLFTKRGLRTFEVHKTQTGDVVYIGYVTSADLAKLNAGGVEIKLFPSLEGEYSNPVAISSQNVLRFKAATTRDDGCLTILVK